ncbi:MAG: alpha/beta fold hydrolase [Polyangiales bacterium]
MAKKPVAVLSRVEPLVPVVRAVDGVRHLTARTVFSTVRRINRGVQAVSDIGVALVARPLGPVTEAGRALEARSPALRTVSGWADEAESAFNAVVGDFLEARDNGLSIKMTIRHGGSDLPLRKDALAEALPRASGKICVFVHGLACSDSIWGDRDEAAGGARGFGAQLETELGFTALYVRYNTGLHVSQNGRALARLLDQVLKVYPVDVTQLVLVGHSMGGLVARSAAHYAKALELPWLPKLSHLMCIASPHFGAPLERAGSMISTVLSLFDTAATSVTRKVLDGRSVGIKDLRDGSVLDDDWMQDDAEAFARDASKHAPFVEGVVYGYVASHVHIGTPGMIGELVGDLLVHLPSATGKHRDVTRHLPFHMGHVIEGSHHLALPTHPAVYEQIKLFVTTPYGAVEAKRLPERV